MKRLLCACLLAAAACGGEPRLCPITECLWTIEVRGVDYRTITVHCTPQERLVPCTPEEEP